jgi:hypothetical protein
VNDLQPAQWGMMREQAAMLVKSGMIPTSIKTPEAAIAIMLKGRELGVPPMQAFAQISVINGKPALGAELMLARIRERYPDADIQIKKRAADGCVIHARRRKSDEYVEFSFSVEDAKRAGVLNKDSWAKYPKAMYYWRTVSDMARSLWPECLSGASHTPEELGAEVDEEGEVVDVPATPAPRRYTGSSEEQQVLDPWLRKAGLPTTQWDEFHRRALGKTKDEFPAIVKDLLARKDAKAPVVAQLAAQDAKEREYNEAFDELQRAAKGVKGAADILGFDPFDPPPHLNPTQLYAAADLLTNGPKEMST